MKKSTVSKQAAERDYGSNRKSEKVAQRLKKSSKVQSSSHVCGDFQTVFDILLPIEVLKPLSAKSSNDVKHINQLPEKLVEENEHRDLGGDQNADGGTGDAGTILEPRLSEGNNTRELSDEEVQEENKDFQLGVEVLAHSKINSVNKSSTNKRTGGINISKGNKRVSFDIKKMKLTPQTKNKNTGNEEKNKSKDDRKKTKAKDTTLNTATLDGATENTEISRHDWLLEAEENQEMFENLGISTASVIKAQYEENENSEDTVLMAGDTVKPLESIPESVAEEVSGTDARDFGAESGSSEESEDDVDLPSEVQEMERKIYELTAAIEKARSKIRMFHKKRELNGEREAEIQELKSYIKNSLAELELYSSRIKELLNINRQKPITEFFNESQKTYIPNENKVSNKQENYIQKSNTVEVMSLKVEKPENNVEENGSTVNGNNKSKSIINSDKKYDNTLDRNEQYEYSNDIVVAESNNKGVNEDALKNKNAKLKGSLWTVNDSSVSDIKNTPIDSSQTNQFNQTEKLSDSDCCIDCIPYNSTLESGKVAVGMSDWQLQERFTSSNKEIRMESSNWISCDHKFETFDQSDEEHIINQTFPLQDTIPKVIICGSRDDVPRIILCDQIKPFKSEEKLVPELVMSLTSRLCNSYSLQEKLAVENAELEGGRYHLQQELLQKDGTVEALQNKVTSLQTELKFVSKENSVLNDKLAMLTQSEHNCPCSCWDKQIASSIEKEEAVDAKLYQYSIQMEEQLVKMWNDLRIVQLEMEQVLREKEQLEYQKHLLNQIHDSPQDLKVVRQQYAKLQEDFNKKDEEVRTLATEIEGLKETEENAKKVMRDSEDSYNTLLEKLDNLERESLQIDVYKEESIIISKKLTSNNHSCDKYRYDIEEIRSQIEESAEQIEYYRKKRFDAQQRVEEQRQQIEEILCETNAIKEQINMQLQIVKGQYEDKIHDLAALPEKLKATQIKLQEAQQTRCFAETNCQDLVKELQNLKEEALKNAREMSVINSNLQQCAESEKELYKKITDSEKKNNELKREISGLTKRVEHLDETNNYNEKHLQEKLKETYQLSKKIEATSEEYAHQHLRMKDRSEMNRLSLQSQISELENELVESRSSAKTAQKERDEMRMKMQIKLDSLDKNYDEAQIRIRCLTTQIQCLQKTCTIMEPLRNDYLSTDDLASSTYVTAALCEAAK